MLSNLIFADFKKFHTIINDSKNCNYDEAISMDSTKFDSVEEERHLLKAMESKGIKHLQENKDLVPSKTQNNEISPKCIRDKENTEFSHLQNQIDREMSKIEINKLD